MCIAGHLVRYLRIPIFGLSPISDHSDIGLKISQSDIIFDIRLTFLGISNSDIGLKISQSDIIFDIRLTFLGISNIINFKNLLFCWLASGWFLR
jgi:hypothetical protein